MVVADRWWSNEPAIRSAQKLSVGLLTWTKNDASIKNALSEISDTEWLKSGDDKEADRESIIVKVGRVIYVSKKSQKGPII